MIHCSFLSFPELQVVGEEETVVVEEEMVEVGEMEVMEEAEEGVGVSSHFMSTFTTQTRPCILCMTQLRVFMPV